MNEYSILTNSDQDSLQTTPSGQCESVHSELFQQSANNAVSNSQPWTLRTHLFARSLGMFGARTGNSLSDKSRHDDQQPSGPPTTGNGGSYANYLDDGIKKRMSSANLNRTELPHYESYIGTKGRSRGSCIGRISKAVPTRLEAKRWLGSARDFVLRKRRQPASKGGRSIPVLVPHEEDPLLIDERTKRPYIDNNITSSIYTPYNFLPRQIIFQFSKLANIYFMAVSIMQMIPSWSTTGSYTTIVPLLVFISISMGREAYDDWRRHRRDSIENNRETQVVRRAANGDLEYKVISWKDVRMGDILQLKQNDWIPADIVLLRTEGRAYIETMALDGETNLKTREALMPLATATNDILRGENSNVKITVEDPNLDLYNFEATVHLGDTDYPLDSNNIVYRGSILRNTPSVLGLVVFTGEESKIRMNAIQNPRSKSPRLQKKANNVVLFMVGFVLFLSVFSTVAGKLYYNITGYRMWYLDGLEVGVVPNLMGFIIMYNTLIPLSLYVSMEIIKVIQVLLLQQDVDMYDAVSNTPCEARTASINEELGQVSYVFSDKTGTLTDNVMIFRKLSVAGTAWIHEDMGPETLFRMVKLKGQPNVEPLHANDNNDDNKRVVTKAQSMSGLRHQPRVSFSATARMSTGAIQNEVPRKSFSYVTRPSTSTWRSTAYPEKVPGEFSTYSLLEYVMMNPHTDYSIRARFFLMSLALCHLCVVEDGEHDKHYSAASPDELALITAANDMGFILMDRTQNSMTIRTYPQGGNNDYMDEVFEVLDVIEFSSARKRMSIVVRVPDGRICVLCKGADNVIMERLTQSKLAQEKSREIAELSQERKKAEAELVIRNSIDQTRRSSLAGRHSISIGGRRSGVGAHVLPSGRHSISYVGATQQNIANSRGSTTRPGRSSISRPSLSIDKHHPYQSINEHLEKNAVTEREMTQIAESSKRSMTLARQRKYGVSDADVSPIAIEAQSTNKRPSKSHVNVKHVQFGANGEQHDVTPSPELRSSNIQDLGRIETMAANDAYVLEKTLEHIEEFSVEGLRTLMYGYKWLDKEEYNRWKKLYSDARTSLVDRQKKIEKIGEMIERDFYLCGATAIEDKLQEGVPEAIEKLRRAGMKLWMLTGDKRETAINIGHSCRLIKDYSTVVVLKSEEDLAARMAAAMLELDSSENNKMMLFSRLGDKISSKLQFWDRSEKPTKIDRDALARIGRESRNSSRTDAGDISINESRASVATATTDDIDDVAAEIAANGPTIAHCVVVVDGMTLSQIEEDATLLSLFADLCVRADSVICCRASPSQKASLVKLVRRKIKSAITLAIGDGANDIAMIQAADVGIGITGKEGLQAARSSDYSIAQFRFLLKLLLVHGRWNYVRTCKYIVGTFYKEFLFYLTQMIFQRNAMFTGTSLYESWSLSMFNTLFTSLPVLCIGIFEKDLRPETLLAVPELYIKGQANQSFGLAVFVAWMLLGASQSVMVCFVSWQLYGFKALTDNTLYPLGVISFTSVICIISIKLQLLEMHYISMVNWICILLSCGGWMCWNMFLSYIYTKEPSKIYFVAKSIFENFGTDASFWATILVVIGIAAVFDILLRLVREKFLKTDTDVFQELEKIPEVRQRLEDEAFSEMANSMAGKVDEDELAERRRERKRDVIKRTLKFRKSTRDYEREVEEILERRERQLDDEF